ncbi:MAG: microcin-processing peptidase 2 [Fibrobacteres bacterium]|nr:microcin-processing peptidase 2 [Fibrobacterota bacterium]
MDKIKAERIIQAGLDRKADFVEIFEEETRNASVSFRDRKVESATAGTDYGMGIRLVYGTEVLYAHTSNDDESHIIKLIDNLARSRGIILSRSSEPTVKLVGKIFENRHKITKDPREIGQEKKLDLIKLADHVARAYSDKIIQVNSRAGDVVSNVVICNSEGLWTEDTRTRSRFTVNVTAESGGEIFTASEAPGTHRGFEFFESLDIAHYAKMASERAVLMLGAGYVKGGKMPVVMGNGFGGVIFHEACGHLLETEAVRRKATPFAGKIGELIAHPSVTAIDDGTIQNAWGSQNIDDEGNPVQKTTLIKDGKLQAYMSDRVGGKETGNGITGSSRRESYQYAPVSRMRNTYIDRGSSTVGAMINSIDHGIYAKKMGGGSVNPATGEFNFAVEEAYIIKNGQIGEPVRGATLIGKGPEILPMISMVGDDLEMAAGMCGAASGSIPVMVGQPTIKVDNILVGGR